jgi:nicotinate-nucleotide--dimethylbenzimidazole phosphoribosyltransferase
MTNVVAPVSPSSPDVFPADARQAMYDIIAARRDIRNFRPDPVPGDVLRRILTAAHQAGSVGFMQPWDFIVIRSEERKARIYDLFREANDHAELRHQGDRRDTYSALKLQGVLDAPVAICVTCDRNRGGPHVLGRDSIPETDLYSSCLAVQNLWLAARAEGVGVGWVSIIDNNRLAAELHLPPNVVPVAYLCIGYPVEFTPGAMLETTGWRGRIPLGDVMHVDTWGTREDSPVHNESASSTQQVGITDPHETVAHRTTESVDDERWLSRLSTQVTTADPGGKYAHLVRARLDELTLPRGSLGDLAELVVRLAGIQQREYPSAERKTLLIFAGDHGVTAEKVSAYRPDVTARLCYNFMAGGGVANALIRQARAELRVIDVGVDHDFGDARGIIHRKVARGTANFLRAPAATRAQLFAALRVGADVVNHCGDSNLVALGEVGIGNTTSASALLAALAGIDAEMVVGAGTGIGDRTRAHKLAVVRDALERHRSMFNDSANDLAGDPTGAACAVGGFEIFAIAGAVLAAAAARRPVVLDGFITAVGAFLATRLWPNAPIHDYLIASHCSAERGHAFVLDRLRVTPLLDLGMRVGEGAGAALVFPIVDAACRILTDVRTFREAGIESPIVSEALL